MKKERKYMEFKIKIYEDWVDMKSPIFWASTTIRDDIKKQIIDVLKKGCIDKLDMPKFKFNKKELRGEILQKLAEIKAQEIIDGEDD